MKIDIMLPFWGDPALLYQAIDSVRAQTDPDWHLTIIDDCYPDDNIGSQVEAHGDPRITYLRNEVNLGIVNNFRLCVQLARAELVVIFGCDDLMLPNYIHAVKTAATQFPEASIIQPLVQVVDETGQVTRPLADRVKGWLSPRVRHPVVIDGEKAAVSLLRGDWLYWPSLAFRREALQAFDFDEDFPIILDLALILDIVNAGGSILYYPTLCFSYRRHSASASSRTAFTGHRFDDERTFFGLAQAKMKALGWRHAERVARSHVTSRLYAVVLVPHALRCRDWAGVKSLLVHLFTRH